MFPGNHGFTCRFNPAGSLGPCSNHDMNPLLRLPVLPDDLKCRLAKALASSSKVTSADLSEDELVTFKTACEEVCANVVEHEFVRMVIRLVVMSTYAAAGGAVEIHAVAPPSARVVRAEAVRKG